VRERERERDSGQIKCLAFRSFNEKKVLNECDERDSLTPVPFFGSTPAHRARYSIYPNFSDRNPTPTKGERQGQRKGPLTLSRLGTEQKGSSEDFY